jgi:NAD-dependent dihydropyrimidine dehydrogenase PreA subunit
MKMIPKWTKKKEYMSYATGHNWFTSQYLLSIYICCIFCRLYVINEWETKTELWLHYAQLIFLFILRVCQLRPDWIPQFSWSRIIATIQSSCHVCASCVTSSWQDGLPITLHTRIQEVLISNLGLDTCYPDVLLFFFFSIHLSRWLYSQSQ